MAEQPGGIGSNKENITRVINDPVTDIDGASDMGVGGGPDMITISPDMITSPGCTFTPVVDFDSDDDGADIAGCRVADTDGTDLGNYSFTCPTDPDEQVDLCDFARQANGPPRDQDDPELWVQGPTGDEPADDDFPSGFGYPNDFDDGYNPNTGQGFYDGDVTAEAHPDPDDLSSSYWDPSDTPPNDYSTFLALGPRPMSAIDFMRFNEFTTRPASSTGKNLVVLGSSMMSTHNQTQNGAMCSRASTAADKRNLRGNDFRASPGWSTRVPWRKALALGRTGFGSGDVRNAAAGGQDACRNNWRGPASPMTTGVNWLTRVGTARGLMLTEGGIINDQQSRTGGWADTLGALVACNAMAQVVPALNAILNAEHAALNPGMVGRRPPTVRMARQTAPGGRWPAVLDLPAGVRAGRCWYATVRGNGRNPVVTLAALAKVEKEVPPLIRLWVGGPAGSPVPGNLTAIKNAYTAINVKQIWLQYPYMDRANVVLKGKDLKLLWPGGLGRLIITTWGPNIAVTIPAIDVGLRPRIRQVTNDLNKLMYDTIGCNAVAAFAAGHPARVCVRAAGAPRVVVTRDSFPGWGAGDHQSTVIGGMPHESAAGANKMGAAVVAADALP